jgi:mediator of replication checkpoint protein 1
MGPQLAPKSHLMAEGTIDRMSKWAKVEGRSRNSGTTGRSVGGAAVTGHAKAKTGGGSLRTSSAAGNSALTSSSKATQRKPAKAQASFLKGVVADKSAYFDQR